jgi:hypothetical protein
MLVIFLVNSLTLLPYWVDAAYAIHHDCKGLICAGMSFGQGMALSYSWKQKIMTNSSTKQSWLALMTLLATYYWTQLH